MAPSSQKGIVITVPVLVLSVSAAAVFLFLLLSSLSTSSPCTCAPSTSTAITTARPAAVSGGSVEDDVGDRRISTSREDIEWVKDQIQANGLHMQDNVLRKGINPRTRAQQLEDLNK